MAIVVLLLIACLVLAPVGVIASVVHLRARLIPADLGWMSAQWPAQYRVSPAD
jgi:hypothetical protein